MVRARPGGWHSRKSGGDGVMDLQADGMVDETREGWIAVKIKTGAESNAASLGTARPRVNETNGRRRSRM